MTYSIDWLMENDGFECVCGKRHYGLLKDCIIGENALIGAGAVVTTHVPAHALMLGVPVRQRGWVCECGEILPESLECKCGRAYVKGEDGMVEK